MPRFFFCLFVRKRELTDTSEEICTFCASNLTLYSII